MSLFESLEDRRHFAFGTVVQAYGTAGVASTTLVGGNTTVEAVQQADGKTLVGSAGGLARYTTTGTLDPTFGNGGVTAFKSFTYLDVAVDGSNRSYVLASAASGAVVLRYTAAGVLDASFGTGGAALVESSKAFKPAAIDVQNDGKIVVAGVRVDATAGNLTRVYRLNAGGSVDNGFASGGKIEFGLGASSLLAPSIGDNVIDLKVLAGGKIEVLGSSYNYAASQTDADGNYTPGTVGSSLVALVRLTGGGAIDTSFATSGYARRATFDNVSLFARAGVIKADGSATIATDGESIYKGTAFVGFNGNGRVDYIKYGRDADKNFYANDATALSDGRTVFRTNTGWVYTVSADGAISNALRPAGFGAQGPGAIVTNGSGDLLLVTTGSRGENIVNFDAGKASDPRVDNLPAAAVIDTAVDANGGLHVAYFDTASNSLKYAFRDAHGYWGGIRTVDKTTGAGAAISIDTIQAKGRTNVAIAYYNANNGDLSLAYSNTNGRRFGYQSVATKGNIGISPSLHYTDTGGFAVSYYSKSTQSLYYSLNNGQGWSTELVAGGGSGLWSEMQFDPTTRRPAIAFTGPKNTVQYALRDKAAGWATLTFATTAAGAAFVNLALPTYAGYGPRVSYYDLATADFVQATYNRYNSPRVTQTTIASRGAVGAYSEILGMSYSNALIAYNRNSDSVIEFENNPYGENPAPITLVTGGGKNLSVASRTGGEDIGALVYTDSASGLTFVR